MFINQKNQNSSRLSALGRAAKLSLSSLNPQQRFQMPQMIKSKTKKHQKALSAYRLVDYSMERVKYNGYPYKYLSSKIDFFNEKNQHKLQISQNKILADIGFFPSGPKPKPARTKRKYNLSPEIHSLVNSYLKKKEIVMKDQGSFMMVGPQKHIFLNSDQL